MTINIHDLPNDLQLLCAQGSWEKITIGRSSDQVFRIILSHGQTYYLKIASYPFEQELLAEKERLAWLQGPLPVPAVATCCSDKQHLYLLLSDIPGLMACDESFAQDIPTLVRLLAEGLQQIHQVNIADCPFDQRIELKIELAKQRLQAGLVDEADFDEDVRADELFKTLIDNQPQSEDVVFTHGDYCFPNILIDPTHMHINGFIDWGRAGIADRHQDLALAARSLNHNFGPGWEPLLWEAYGLESIDLAKIKFYQLLDEFI